jgi:hypothetical protein
MSKLAFDRMEQGGVVSFHVDKTGISSQPHTLQITEEHQKVLKRSKETCHKNNVNL